MSSLKPKNFIILALSILLPLFIGGLSSFLVTGNQGEQYASFIQPSFAPPGWVFGPVWTVLYILMGVAAWLIYRQIGDRRMRIKALAFYFVQLIFNFTWTGIFFGLGRFDWAFMEIVILWFLILATIIYFARINKLAAWLLAPYIMWVSFAAVLNFSIWQLN